MIVRVAGLQILIDAGLRPKSSGEESLPALSKISGRLDAIILTHAHIDHLGALPVVHQRYPKTPVFTSEPTAALAKVMLLDSAYLQKLLPGPALYNKNDVEHTITYLRPLLMNRWYHLAYGIAFSFIPAGHLLGAVSILLDTAEGRIVITGDISLTHQRAISGFSATNFPADLLVLESTYGDSVHPDRREEELRLVENVTDVVLSGGTALVPSFALGRAQEVILTLRQAQLTNEIPSYPIYVDGLVRAVTDVYYSKLSYLAPALRESPGHPFWKDKRVMKVRAFQRSEISGPACIVASSGMLFGGPSVFYARQLVGDPASAIFITGYTDEESPGRKLQNLKSGHKLMLDGKPYEVACQVRKFGLSGHADAKQLAQVAEHFQPRRILLVHGEEDGRMSLKERLPDRYSVDLPTNTENFTFDPPNWLIPNPSYMLDRPDGPITRMPKSSPVGDVAPLAGEASLRLPKLGIKRVSRLEGALVKEDIPSDFPCMLCGSEKLVTIDLSLRQMHWRCSNCDNQFEENIMNLRQKDVGKLSEKEQEDLVNLILVSLRLHEPTLDKTWSDMLEKPEKWGHWLGPDKQ